MIKSSVIVMCLLEWMGVIWGIWKTLAYSHNPTTRILYISLIEFILNSMFKLLFRLFKTGLGNTFNKKIKPLEILNSNYLIFPGCIIYLTDNLVFNKTIQTAYYYWINRVPNSKSGVIPFLLVRKLFPLNIRYSYLKHALFARHSSSSHVPFHSLCLVCCLFL